MGVSKIMVFAKASLPVVHVQNVGGFRDAHGCLGSAGFSWSDKAQACLRPWENKEDFPELYPSHKMVAHKMVMHKDGGAIAPATEADDWWDRSPADNKSLGDYWY